MPHGSSSTYTFHRTAEYCFHIVPSADLNLWALRFGEHQIQSLVRWLRLCLCLSHSAAQVDRMDFVVIELVDQMAVLEMIVVVLHQTVAAVEVIARMVRQKHWFEVLRVSFGTG
jgi:hypothetical protein